MGPIEFFMAMNPHRTESEFIDGFNEIIARIERMTCRIKDAQDEPILLYPDMHSYFIKPRAERNFEPKITDNSLPFLRNYKHRRGN